MLIMTSMIRVGQSQFVSAPIDEDSSERIMTCIETLSQVKDKEGEQAISDIFLHDTKAAYAKMVAAEEVNSSPIFDAVSARQADSCLSFIFLSGIEKSSRDERERDQNRRYSGRRRNLIPAVLEKDWCRCSG